MQSERRRDPYPWSWEIPVAILVAVFLVVVLGIQLGRSAANLVVGAGWTWPAADTGAVSSPVGTAFWASVPRILAGDAGAGLTDPVPDAVASPGVLWSVMVLSQLVFLSVTVWGSANVYVRWGPGRMRGMATAAEAEKLLGVTRLHKVAAIVRPDLHTKHANPAIPSSAPRYTIGEAEPSRVRIGRGLVDPWLHPRDKDSRE